MTPSAGNSLVSLMAAEVRSRSIAWRRRYDVTVVAIADVKRSKGSREFATPSDYAAEARIKCFTACCQWGRSCWALGSF
jgi:hypothetical protein